MPLIWTSEMYGTVYEYVDWLCSTENWYHMLYTEKCGYANIWKHAITDDCTEMYK